jgi:uncharacterized membrane protein YeaQ/YmgE (transglycosylase-associated protein family)
VTTALLAVFSLGSASWIGDLSSGFIGACIFIAIGRIVRPD